MESAPLQTAPSLIDLTEDSPPRPVKRKHGPTSPPPCEPSPAVPKITRLVVPRYEAAPRGPSDAPVFKRMDEPQRAVRFSPEVLQMPVRAQRPLVNREDEQSTHSYGTPVFV